MKTNFRMMLLAMATLGVFSCSDKLADEANLPQGEDHDGFIAFKIGTMNTGTRAEGDTTSSGEDKGTDAGSPKEHEIIDELGANIAFFFGNNGNYHSRSFLRLMADGSQEENGSEKVYSARIKKDKNRTPNVDSCVVILNANPTILEGISINNLSDLQKLIDDQLLGMYKGYFTMSNSVYLKTDGTKRIKDAQGITEKQICDTWAEAQKNKVVVHVERLVAKFEVMYKGDNLNNNTITFAKVDEMCPIKTADRGDGNSAWGIRLKGWGVNGKETKTYWIKNLVSPDHEDNMEKFGNWNYAISDSYAGWNNADQVRSYWSIDPHYGPNQELEGNTSDKELYPQQYRKVEIGEEKSTVAGYVKSKCALSYISYKDLTESMMNQIGENIYDYAPENTFGHYSFFKANAETEAPYTDYAFMDDDYKRTSTHILVAAELLLGTKDETEALNEPEDTYCYLGAYYSKSVSGNDYESLLIQEMVDQVISSSFLLYTNQSGTPLDITKATDYFELIPAAVKGGDGCQMLALKDDAELYKMGDNNEYKQVKSNDLEDAIAQAGVAKHFANGQMYYAIPIQHMVPTLTKKDGTHLYNIGSYGVVRNHWYQINISDIKKPGISIDDPEQPIIPNDEPYESAYVAFEIVIIPWHKISQEVEF